MDDFIPVIGFAERERVRRGSPRCGQRQKPQWRHEILARTIERAEAAVASVRDCADQMLERRYEVGLVEYHERISPEQAGMIGAHPPRHPIALEQ